MQRRRAADRAASSAFVAKPRHADEIQERYLRRAIARDQRARRRAARRSATSSTFPSSAAAIRSATCSCSSTGRPQSEIHEGVAFFGRAGQALLKSLQRLGVDPLAVYGTNCLKFGTEDAAQARGWLTRELHIVQPKLLVVDGRATVALPRRRSRSRSREPLDAERSGELQRFTPTIEALVTPDIDESLDEQDAKTRFWNAFKALGAWWAELPPY